jgi:outer membrane protein assembly factor BamB
MLSLRFLGSRSRFASESSSQRRFRATGILGVAALVGALACGNDDDGDGPGTVALADSGSLFELTTEIGIPTTVAVANNVAWVVESQFDRYAPFMGTGTPAPFRLLGVSLAPPPPAPTLLQINLPPNFFPEGITTTAGGRLFVGSVSTGDIYTVDPNTTTANLFSDELAPSTIGMTVGNDNASLWICSTNTAATPPTALVIGMAIADRARLATHVLPGTDAGAFCNDMVMSPDGALWVTESANGRIYRIDPANIYADNSAEVWLEDELLQAPMPGGFGTNGITLLGGRLYTVVTGRGQLYAIDPTIEAPTGADLKLIELGSPLVGPDGITRVPGSDTDILIVENGLGAQGGKKLLRARLDRL